MTRYVALLRGINVGGRTAVSMAELRAVFADLDLGSVQTYLRSGNVVFEAPAGDRERLRAEIERAVADRFAGGFGVLLRTAPELRAVLASNPFADRQVDPTKLLVAFLSADRTGRADRLAPPPGETGQLSLAGREVYLHLPDGAARTKLTTAFVEKRLGVTATARNWRSVLALRELASRRTPAGLSGGATGVQAGTAGT